jgi:hypothetical protein
VVRGTRSPLFDAVLNIARSEPRDASASFVVEDRPTGYHRRILVESQVTVKAGERVYTGLEKEGEAAVCVDIDTYTRPESGHFQKSTLFIQNSFHRSREIAMEILQWLRQQR